MLCLPDANIPHEKQIWVDDEIENNSTNDYDLQHNAGTFYYLALINEKERRTLISKNERQKGIES